MDRSRERQTEAENVEFVTCGDSQCAELGERDVMAVVKGQSEHTDRVVQQRFTKVPPCTAGDDGVDQPPVLRMWSKVVR